MRTELFKVGMVQACSWASFKVGACRRWVGGVGGRLPRAVGEASWEGYQRQEQRLGLHAGGRES